MNKNKIAMVAPIAVAGILTLAVLTAISSTNLAFAQQKPTELTLNVSPDNQGASSYLLKGKLTSEGVGLGGKTIDFTSSRLSYVGHFATAVTAPDGTYSVTTTKPLSTVSAWYLGVGDLEHSISKSIITLPP